ncbi:MAG TPA: hypothetical protein VJT09_00775, partial [Pyrinomonadaceae bacterium]|nr:hypothetical protein [Pyrinomonadaceae bacterium]
MTPSESKELAGKPGRKIEGSERRKLALLVMILMVASASLACGASQTSGNQTNATQANAAAASPTPQATPEQPVTITEGDVTITPIMHASLQLEYGGKVIQVDPTGQGDYTKAKQAD